MKGLGPEATALLEAARQGDEPTRADRERVRGAIAARLAAGTAAGLGVTAAAKSSVAAALLAGSATKVVVTMALIGFIGAGAVWVAKAGYRRPVPDAVARTSGAAAVVGRPEVAVVPSNSLAPVAPAAEKPAAALHPGVRSTGGGATAPAAHAPVAGDVASEVRLLGEAHAAIRGGDAERALALLDEHARRFPKGALGEEREAARIAALCALHRTSEARDATERFLHSAPRSPLAGALRTSCGGDPSSSPAAPF
jgi:hypothetical protein